jgi:Nif-specific regulatory protein
VRARFRCPQLIGRSKAMARMLHAASLVAPLDIDVLITGPCGTGKSALARAIVDNGARAGRPFVELNCATFQETLVEAELFGAEKGSHSTAHKKILGKVAAAEGGTLFLDEIAELAPGAQAKLLQLLQERSYHPLGATKAEHADVRIITATNANLRAAVAAKKFREDLYYRVNVLPLELPGLSERRDDIPDLVEHFAVEHCAKHRFPAVTVSRRASNACCEADWPGHVRELGNQIERAVIFANGEHSKTLLEHHIFPSHTTSGDPNAPVTFHEGTRQYQERLVREALERNHWNAAHAARDLDLARSYVYNLIHEFGLERAKDPAPGGKR